jgi:uncharacterized protein
MKIRSGLLGFIAVIQAILFAAHWFVYETWAYPWNGASHGGGAWLKVAFAILAVSFVGASLLAFKYTNFLVRIFYRIAAIWIGLLSFLFFGAVASWVVNLGALASGVQTNGHRVTEFFFLVAMVLALVGLLNAQWTRLTRILVKLPNLPAAWRGRKVALLSDLHLGHVRNGNFLRRIVDMVMSEKPDAILIAGDLYDGTAIDAYRAAKPLNSLKAPHGAYFVAGNHEQFGDDSRYIQAVAQAGVRVLDNEKVDADGLQIAGVGYKHATHDGHLRSVLQQMRIDPKRASILLTHAPDRPHIAAEAGISLQVSGHTHVGQFLPWTWLAKRMYHRFVYGLSQLGNLQIYTSSGAGTWGPPLRLGSIPEVVLLQFE